MRMPLFRRFGRPGLLESVPRSAVVAGTATMTARAVNRSPQLASRGVAAKTDGAGTGATEESVTSQLVTLSSLHTSGAISDDEFAQAKKKVLGG
jgi:hypothetical protein